MAQQTWVISGKLIVKESDITGVLTNRPLANAEVEVEASNFGVYASWGTVRTDSEGACTLRNEKDKSKRKLALITASATLCPLSLARGSLWRTEGSRRYLD
jgi:hypothetical protein